MTINYLEKYQMPFNPCLGWSICRISFCILQTFMSRLTFIGYASHFDCHLPLCRDLSSNNFSGKLPPSVENLSSLTTLWVFCLGNAVTHLLPISALNANFIVVRRLQNNQLSGTLDGLQDLPLRDLYCSRPCFNFQKKTYFLLFYNLRIVWNFHWLICFYFLVSISPSCLTGI